MKVTDFILEMFAGASGLLTNMSKTQFFPIQCDEINLDFLTSNGRAISTFPCTYLDLPLSFKSPTKTMLQPLMQKIANRLPGWARGFLSYPGRDMLVQSVLSAMPIFFISVFKPARWLVSGIDKYRRSFLWRGKDHDQVRGGHCLVNWPTCIKPKYLGGLGIKDIDKFSRALRLRWFWHSWDYADRQWKHLIKFQDPTDKVLFFNSTYIQVGDGRNTPFWEARWLFGTAPKEMAPDLYAKVRFKSRSVHYELNNGRWIRNLGEITSSDLLEQFVMLHMTLSSISLTDQKDQIFWKWTNDRKFSVSSAYNCQFIGAMSTFPASHVWTAATEPKCRFFAWLTMHNKALTADNMLKKNWPCDPTCSLCFCLPESVEHLLTGCNFAEAVWNVIAPDHNLPSYSAMAASGGPMGLPSPVVWV
jgi:hypothetical protein